MADHAGGGGGRGVQHLRLTVGGTRRVRVNDD